MPREPCSTYNFTLCGAHVEIDIRPYAREATNCDLELADKNYAGEAKEKRIFGTWIGFNREERKRICAGNWTMFTEMILFKFQREP